MRMIESKNSVIHCVQRNTFYVHNELPIDFHPCDLCKSYHSSLEHYNTGGLLTL